MIFENVLGEGHEDIWEFVIDENRPNTGNNKDEYPYYLKAPFLTLKHTYSSHTLIFNTPLIDRPALKLSAGRLPLNLVYAVNFACQPKIYVI